MTPVRSIVAAVTVLAALAALTAPAAPAAAADAAVVVFAAASLKNALDDAVAIYGERTAKRVVVSYAATSTLARQIEQAAPADLFFPADVVWMDYLQERGLIRSGSRHTLLGNRLVLIAPRDSGISIDIAPGMDLASGLGTDGHLAMANTDSVPAGRYGKAALASLGAWKSVADRVVHADSVRAALAFVARGEAPLGVVYATDAAAEPKVRVLGAFPGDSHPPILYSVAIAAASRNPDAGAFLDFLLSDDALAAFTRHGFALAAPGS